jgi:tryptophanyl-tRNA synthetase
LRKLIMGIVTDSKAPGEPKDTEGSALFQIYQAFASAEETARLAQAYAEGIAWGDAKQRLFERLDQEIAPMRAVYDELISDPARIERTLRAGAEKARAMSRPFTDRLRHAVGLRALDSTDRNAPAAKSVKAAAPVFKQYREDDGQFRFKLLDSRGALLLQSTGFASPRDAAQAIARLRLEGTAALEDLRPRLEVLGEMAAVSSALAHFKEEA